MHDDGTCEAKDQIGARTAAVVVAVALGLLLAPVAASAQGILPPGSVVHGKTIGEWTQEWWSWYLSYPAAIEPFGDEPLTDETGEHAHDQPIVSGRAQSGPVFFVNALSGPTVSGPVTRTFSLPSYKPVLLPLINFIWVSSAGETCGEVAPLVEGAVDGVDSLFLEIDGVEIPESELALHRVATGCFEMTVPVNGNAGNEPIGVYPGSYASGYWVVIPPLPPGPHVIHAVATHSGFEISIDVTDNVTPSLVVPALPALGAATLATILLGSGLLGLRRRKSRSTVG